MDTIACPRCKTENPKDRDKCENCELNLKLFNRLVFRLLQFATLLFLLALSLGGLFIMNAQPLQIITCRHLNMEQVDCQVQERMIWLISRGETSFPGLKKAYVDQLSQVGEDEDGNEVTFYSYQVVMVNDSGEFVLRGSDEHGIISEITSNRINHFLATPKDNRLTIWWYGLATNILITVIGGFVFLLFGFLFFSGLVDLIFGPNTIANILTIRKKEDQDV